MAIVPRTTGTRRSCSSWCRTTVWLDVGCGRSIFPHTRAAAKLLAERCQRLVGLDPSDNIRDNDIVHERAQCRLEDYVAEPEGAIAALSRLIAPGGRVVVFTVDKWAPVTILSGPTLTLSSWIWQPRRSNRQILLNIIFWRGFFVDIVVLK